MVWQFEKPEDIRKFGRMLNDFSLAGKVLARAMPEMNFTRVETELIVGEGHYNTLDDQKPNFIRYAKHTAMPLRGLFGAFVLAHIPEMALVRRMPTMLGKLGYELIAVRDNFEVASRPLNGDDFGFVGYGDPARGNGSLTLCEEWRLPDGRQVTPADTRITKDYVPRSFVTGPLRFVVRDGSGMMVADNIATQILWGSQGAQGMKTLGLNNPRRTVLGGSGTDDDFTAETAMIDCLDELRKKHQTDLMPAFNQMVTRQAAILGDGNVCTPAIYLAASKMIVAGKRSLESMRTANFHSVIPDDDQELLQMFNQERIETSMERLADCFDLTLPATLADAPEIKAITDRFVKDIDTVGDRTHAALYAQRRKNIVGDIIRTHIQTPEAVLTANFTGTPAARSPYTLHVVPNYDNGLKIESFIERLTGDDRRRVMAEMTAELPVYSQRVLARELTELASIFRELSSLQGSSKNMRQLSWVAHATEKVAAQYVAQPDGFVIAPGLLIAMESLISKSSKVLKTHYRQGTGKDLKANTARRRVDVLRAVKGDLRQVTARFSIAPDLTALPFFADLKPPHAVQRPITFFQIQGQNSQLSSANL